MKSDKEVNQIISLLDKEYPEPKTALNHINAFELLIATILSAQCTDKRVNKVTPKLFKKYSNPKLMSEASVLQIQELIKSINFFRNKAISLKQTSERIVNNFNGLVPDNMNDLLSLRGVARKTANVVLGNAFNKLEGIVVDTHVKRLSKRIGLTDEDKPERVEIDLMKIIPKKEWTKISHLLIYHGRKICDARKPNCESCVLKNNCDNAFKFPHYF